MLPFIKGPTKAPSTVDYTPLIVEYVQSVIYGSNSYWQMPIIIGIDALLGIFMII